MTRGGAAAARMAHNHEVAGSSPAPATKTSAPIFRGFCFGTEARFWFCDADFALAKDASRRDGGVRTRAATSFDMASTPQRRSDERSEGSAVLLSCRAAKAEYEE